MKKRMTGAFSLLGLICAYLMLRYPLLFLHYMISWSFYLFVIGIIVIVISGLILSGKILPVFTLIGYLIGFILGYIFQSDYGDYDYCNRNNFWAIWTCVYLGAILIGIAAEIFCNKRAHKQ